MYVIGIDKEEVLTRKQEFFDHYMKTNHSYIDIDDPMSLVTLKKRKKSLKRELPN